VYRTFSVKRIAKVIVLLATTALIVAAGLTLESLRLGQREQPPCHECAEMSSEVQQVSVCELSGNHQQFAGRRVRVVGEFVHDSGELSLRGEGCILHTGFSGERRACGGAWRRLQVTCGVNGWFDGSAPVRVLGTISEIPSGNHFAGEEGFTISCLEEVQTEPSFSQRKRFAIGRWLNGLF